MLEKAESRQGQITELQEENRALKNRFQSDKEVQAFRRAQPGEVPVLRETVSYERSRDANPSQYERSRSRSDQMLKEVRQNADEALRMTVDQAALERAVRYNLNRNRVVQENPLTDPYKKPPPPRPDHLSKSAGWTPSLIRAPQEMVTRMSESAVAGNRALADALTSQPKKTFKSPPPPKPSRAQTAKDE